MKIADSATWVVLEHLQWKHKASRRFLDCLSPKVNSSHKGTSLADAQIYVYKSKPVKEDIYRLRYMKTSYFSTALKV